MISFLVARGLSATSAKLLVYVGLPLLILAALAGAKCAYDASVINRHETKQELRQVKRERAADQNLQNQIGRDQAAKEQRQQEIENATRNIPDQAPSARQRARACVELQRQAKERGKPVPAC